MSKKNRPFWTLLDKEGMILKMRNKIIAGNWKMNMLPNEAINFLTELPNYIKDCKHEVILCVPFIDLFYSLLAVQEMNM